MTDFATLEADLLAAHDAGDEAALAVLYANAAEAVAPDRDRAAFYLTQAYVFALSSGAPTASKLKARLAQMGRDVPH